MINIKSVNNFLCSHRLQPMYLNKSRSQIYKWRDAKFPETHEEEEERGQYKFPNFRDTLDQLLAKQMKETLNKGLDNTFNATIAKLVLANHGMHD